MSEILIGQATEYVRGLVDHANSVGVGDSPIEKLLFASIVLSVAIGVSPYKEVAIVYKQADLGGELDKESTLSLLVVPQAHVAGWRVDFLIYAWDVGVTNGKPHWRRLIVECDGHDYHERTRFQAARDRARDRRAQLNGYTILRFTGSEIHNDPLGCARQISDWATMGWRS